MSVRVLVRDCVCVCVCERERESERERKVMSAQGIKIGLNSLSYC